MVNAEVANPRGNISFFQKLILQEMMKLALMLLYILIQLIVIGQFIYKSKSQVKSLMMLIKTIMGRPKGTSLGSDILMIN